MNEKKIKRANFDIDAQKWDRFRKISKINESTATQEIRKFINKYLSDNAQLKLKV